MISLSRCCPPAASFLCAGLLVFGVRAQGAAPDAPPAPFVFATPPVQAEAAGFDAVTARLDRGGSFYLYLATSQWLDNLSQQIDQWRDLALPTDAAMTDANREQVRQCFDLAAAFIKKSGLEQITGAGASSLALEPGVYRNTVFVHHDKGQETGFLNTLFGSAPHPLTALDLLPADTAAANFGDGDLAGLLGVVRTTLEQSGLPEVKKAVADGLSQFSALTGMSFDDFLQSLGGSGGLILTLDPAKQIELPMPGTTKQSIPSPRLAVLIETKNDRIFKRVEQLLGMFPGVEKIEEPGLRMLTIGFPAMPQLNVRATVAQWGNFLLLASDDRLVRDIIAAQSTGQGFKASPEFAKLSAGLPVEGNGFGLATPVFTDTIRRVQSAMFEHQPGATAGQMELMHKLFAVQAPGGAYYGVSAHVEDGWLSVSKGPQSLNQVVLPLLIVPVAISAGIALPVFKSVEEKGKATKSLAQAKQIGLACKLYAADHDGNFPPSLPSLMPTYTESTALFVSPFGPDAPLGYSYTPGLTTSSPGDTILLEDMFSAKDGERVVIHVDGSGEVTRVPKK